MKEKLVKIVQKDGRKWAIIRFGRLWLAKSEGMLTVRTIKLKYLMKILCRQDV